jgi:integrase
LGTLETGLRPGEILNARWINIQGEHIYIGQTKTDRPRRVPLTKKAQDILNSLRQDAPDEKLIFEPKRTGRKRRQLMVCFEQAVKNSGIGDFHCHDLRWTLATRLRAAGVHDDDIADLLGHSVPEGKTRWARITKGICQGRPAEIGGCCLHTGEGEVPDFWYAIGAQLCLKSIACPKKHFDSLGGNVLPELIQ